MNNETKSWRKFGKFRLDTEKKVLWFEDETVKLQLKEIELLCVLTENRGEVVTKDELFRQVWPNSFVEESNLARHIYQIRKVFKQYGESENLILTVPRRGYRFTGDGWDDSDEVIFERHSVSRTLIETLEDSDSPDILPREPTRSPRKYSKLFVASALTFVFLLSAFGLFFHNRRSNAVGVIKSLAVLPLKSLGRDEPDKALNLGFADTLITNLGKLGEVRVLSAQTVSRLADENQEPLEAARRLEVDAVIDGTLQKADGKYRITLRLTRVSDGRQIWTQTFDKEEGKIFALQDEMATETARALALNLNLESRKDFLRHYTENTDAYQAYRSGRYLHLQREYEKAVREFEKALEFDSKYVLAYAGLADSYSFLANSSESTQSAKLYEKAKSYAFQALALDPNLAEAHASLGWVRRIYDWDWAEAEKHLRRAVELDPNSSIAHQRLAYLYITLGRTEEAVTLSKQAKQLDPINHSIGWAFFCNRQYEASLAEYERRLGFAGTFEMQREPRLGMAIALIELGRFDEAIRIFEESPPEIKNDFALNSALAIAYYRAGKTAKGFEVLKFLEEKARQKQGRWVRLAFVYAVFGKKDETFDALEKGLETRDDRLMWIKTTPYFDALREDPRFRGILSKMNLSN